MAFNIPCKYCGCSQSDHECEEDEEGDQILFGKELTLNECRASDEGYVPEDEALHKELLEADQKEEMARLQREFGGSML